MAGVLAIAPWTPCWQCYLPRCSGKPAELGGIPLLQTSAVGTFHFVTRGSCPTSKLATAGLACSILVRRRPRRRSYKSRARKRSREYTAITAHASLEDAYSLPSKLSMQVSALKSLPNDRLRYQQLMALGSKLPTMPVELKTPHNKVPGCLSTVHVHAKMKPDGTIEFQGDSDALISKGLVALLVGGLSGCTVEQVTAVNPEFIKASGITASLTPGRNNGFFNMFTLMKSKASALMNDSSIAEPFETASSLAGRRSWPAHPRLRLSKVAAIESDLATDATLVIPQLNVYDTLERRKRPLEPLSRGSVNMYVCGVTVYDLCHLGHARVMVFFDIVARYLKHTGFAVKFVRNVTDIDDKIIKRANENGEDPLSLARRMEEEMQHDAAELGCCQPSEQPRVSDHIQDIINMVASLIEKKFAYPGAQQGEGRDVYFRVRSFSKYGRLSRCNLDGNQAGARVEVAEGKEAPEDFVLWKAAKLGEPSWESPWGAGRPGWHIECSAMAKRHLGITLDIHGGGPDLVFPHHENEIAQSEAANGAAYVTTWMHCAAVRSRGDEKMSKSLGNFVTIRDALKRFDGETLRFYLLSSQYRQPLLYSEEILAQSSERLLKLYSSLRGSLSSDLIDAVNLQLWPSIVELRERFYAAMSNDFDTVTAIATLNELSRELLQLRQGGNTHSDAAACVAHVLRQLGGVLGLLQRDPEEVLRGRAAEDSEFEAQVESLVTARFKARKAKDWARADALRKELSDLGVVLEDGATGTTWRVGTLTS